MKHFVFLIVVLMLGVGNSRAKASENKVGSATLYGYSSSFIFAENGITFAVYPDGEFDFYIDNRVHAGVRIGAANITFNSGFNYSPYVQYDDYGAVIQVQHVPVYYDYYGRVNRIGGIQVYYRNGLVYRLGGMRVFYNPMGFYDYHIGYINPFNRVYVYRPFHRYFVRPAYGHCMVYADPYRRYYHPVRYTYYRPYHNNARRAYARVGKTYRYHPRSERSRIYRNDHRVVARESVRSNRKSLSSSARSQQYSKRPANYPRYAENSSGRSSGFSKGESLPRVERTSTRDFSSARNGSGRVVNGDDGARYGAAENSRKAVKRYSGVTSDRTDRRMAANNGSKNRTSGVRSQEKRNGRAGAATRSTKGKPDRASQSSRRE